MQSKEIRRCPSDGFELSTFSEKVQNKKGEESEVYVCPFCKLRYVDYPQHADIPRYLIDKSGYINLSANCTEVSKNVKIKKQKKKPPQKNKFQNNNRVKHKGHINVVALMQSSIPSHTSAKKHMAHDTDGMSVNKNW